MLSAAGDEVLHLLLVAVGLAEELPLCAAAHEIVLSVLRLVVEVAVDVVGEEAHGLHVGEELGGVGEILDLDGCEEGGGSLQVALGKALEDFHVEGYVV